MFGSPEGLIGQVIGGYRLERVLGTGAMGVVFQGQADANPQGPVAIKLLVIPWNVSTEDRAQYHNRFRREAQTLQRLRHAHILSLLDFGEAEGFTYMVLPYLAGGTLANLLKRRGRLSLNEAASYLTRLAGALDYAHSQHVIHRDIKPGNVLLDTQNQPYLADFSIVRFTDLGHTTLTIKGQVMGTPAYQSPEQAAGQPVGPGVDIYSLGVVIYELLTGQPPFQADSLTEFIRMHAHEPPPPPSQLRPDLPEPAAAALLKALAKRPADRWQSAGAFAQAFALGVQGQWALGLAQAPTDGLETVQRFTPPPTLGVSPPPTPVQPTPLAPQQPPSDATRPVQSQPSPAPVPVTPQWASPTPHPIQGPMIPKAHPGQQWVPPPGPGTLARPERRDRKSRAGLVALVLVFLLVLVVGGSGVALGANGVGPLAPWFVARATATQPATTTTTFTATFTPTSPPVAHGTFTTFAGPTPAYLTLGPDKAIWFTEQSGKIARLTVDGRVTNEYVVPTSGAIPQGIVAGPDGNLWFTEGSAPVNSIGRMTISGTFSAFPIPSPKSFARSIAVGSDGNLWFTEEGLGKVGKITVSGTIQEYTIRAGAFISGIAKGGDGNIWFTEGTSNYLGRITPSGVIAEFPVTCPDTITSSPDRDGNLWFREGCARNVIGKVSPAGVITEYSFPGQSDPGGITVGSDGNIWFMSYYSGGDKLGQSALSGQITEKVLTNKPTFGGGILSGPDGNLWFATEGGIGRFVP